DQTTFTFQHNYDKPVDVDLIIFTIAGRKILTIHKENIVSKFVMIDWDGRDNEGAYLGNGVYLYKIIVKTTDNSLRSEEIGKLAIVR
ncbi:MAG: hypothetical protein N3A61_07640, partial [Ignavibacteria bacterium]|nr:hypothetical protein [Ignavibacteria bacterium]